MDSEPQTNGNAQENDSSLLNSTESSWQQVVNSSQDSTADIDKSQDSFMNVEHDNDEDKESDKEEDEVEKDLDTALQHKTTGNKYYKLKQYDEALYEYTMAIKYCPLQDDKDKEFMSIFYGNRAACHIALEEWQDALDECTKSIEYNDQYIKAYWRRAKSCEKLEKYYDAKADYQQILEIDPNHEISKANLERIEPLVQQQFEKQKEEVMTTLKGGANWLLGKVGLSLDNFEATQNPETGAYNINFKQNPRQ